MLKWGTHLSLDVNIVKYSDVEFAKICISELVVRGINVEDESEFLKTMD
jgi:hypothetical protein